jgi:hypothetical protein
MRNIASTPPVALPFFASEPRITSAPTVRDVWATIPPSREFEISIFAFGMPRLNDHIL